MDDKKYARYSAGWDDNGRFRLKHYLFWEDVQAAHPEVFKDIPRWRAKMTVQLVNSEGNYNLFMLVDWHEREVFI
jgi:hypothetical protein